MFAAVTCWSQVQFPGASMTALWLSPRAWYWLANHTSTTNASSPQWARSLIPCDLSRATTTKAWPPDPTSSIFDLTFWHCTSRRMTAAAASSQRVTPDVVAYRPTSNWVAWLMTGPGLLWAAVSRLVVTTWSSAGRRLTCPVAPGLALVTRRWARL